MDLQKQYLDEFLSLGKQAVHLASQHLHDYWGKASRIKLKESYHSIVSEEDFQSERIIIEFLERALPRHSFVSEERGQLTRHSEFTWIIDPLDGSSYYVRGLQSFSVSLALLYECKPILGIVACPSSSELFTVIRAGGAYLNDSPIRVSSIGKLQDSILGFSHSLLRETRCDGLKGHLVSSCRSIRGGGSCAQELCYIACGRTDGFIAAAQGIWDFAAGALLVEEAGGQFTDFSGEPLDYSTLSQTDFSVVASNGHLHSRILESLSSIPRD